MTLIQTPPYQITKDSFKSQRQLYLEAVDRKEIKPDYKAETMRRIRYPLKGLKYDEQCKKCGARVYWDSPKGKRCLGCWELLEE